MQLATQIRIRPGASGSRVRKASLASKKWGKSTAETSLPLSRIQPRVQGSSILLGIVEVAIASFIAGAVVPLGELWGDEWVRPEG